MTTVLYQTSLPSDLKLRHRGKVRDIYDIDTKRMLIVATDRISAFDVVMPNGIPDKGKVLTQLSFFWFDLLKGICKNHLLDGLDEYLKLIRPEFRSQLEGRSMLVRRVKILPVECIVRGYLSGSGWKSYQKDGTVCGIKLPIGLQESEELPMIIFTPTTKAESGHDQNITFGGMIRLIGVQRAVQLQNISIDLYNAAAIYARKRGIIIADTKFEFGLDDDGNLILADEVLTPDSSRFWPADDYKPGRPQDSFDKQYLRDWLESTDWDKEPPAPELPDDVVVKTRAKYLEAYERLTGKKL